MFENKNIFLCVQDNDLFVVHSYKNLSDIFMRSQVNFPLLVNEVMEKSSHILLCYPPTRAALWLKMFLFRHV